MSGIKTLFEKQKEDTLSAKTLQKRTAEELFYDAESPQYISNYQDSINLYLQDVDFATASNFARFGSARKYYENITTRITNYFPYDGSKAEQLEFENNLNPFEKYIYLYQYPRTTGYVNFSPSGWGNKDGALVSGFGLPENKEYIYFYNQNQDNSYDPDNNLRENLRLIFSSGSTVEFWMKKNAFPDATSQTAKECIFYTISSGSLNRLFIHTNQSLSNSSIYVNYSTYDAGTSLVTQRINFAFNTGLATIADSNWHHYAITFYSSSAGYTSDFYFDGIYKETKSSLSTIIDLTGSAFSTIGALGGPVTIGDLTGYGKLSGSIDEFRFWNEKRDAKQIGLNYFVNVGGGNNKANTTNLGIYYKFNEGIIGTSSIDSIVLDYAGRNCNGSFIGYNTSSRNTGSAITDTQENPEQAVPILYYDHQNIQTFLTEKLYYADEHDYKNNFSLKNSLPRWILDDDANNGDTLVNLLQTISSYLDTLYLQINTYKNLKNKDYLNYKGKAPPFSDLLLTSNGFDLPSLFLNTDIIQSLLNQDSKKTYNEKINDLKNIIYKNIYNNLDIIYKSKGTENSIKQLIKTFGVDQEVFNLNIYANNTQYQLSDSYINKSIKKSYIDFTPFVSGDNKGAVIYQSGSNSFITGTDNNNLSFTLESNLIIPEFPPDYDYLSYKTLTYNSASLLGFRTATNNNSEISVSGSDPAAIKIGYAYRDKTGYFYLNYPYANLTLTSSIFSDLLINQHWNISARLQSISTGSSFNLIFSGYSNFINNAFREFNVSSSITTNQGNNLLSNNKRIYIGAERNNILGTVQKYSLSKPLSVRYWSDFLDNEELKEHAKNSNNYGRIGPEQPYSLATASYIPKSETLLLHWDFTNVTSSDSNGNVSIIYDLTSGSSTGNSYSNSPLNNLVGKSYDGAGYGFAQNSTIGGLDLVYSSEQQLPENLYSSQLINILSTDDDYYTSAIRPQNYFFSLENSMYAVISKNILNMFASILEFNNFIGEPGNMYKIQYSKLKFFRNLFFNKVGNIPDLDRYVGVYKWIDDALDSVLFNLLPASANASEKVRTIVEDHVLERGKIHYNLLPDKAAKVIGNKNLGAVNEYFLPPTTWFPPPPGPFPEVPIPGPPPKTRKVANPKNKRTIYSEDTGFIRSQGAAAEDFEKTSESNLVRGQTNTIAARIGRTR